MQWSFCGLFTLCGVLKKIANKSKILDNFSNKCTQFLDFLIVIKYFNSVIHWFMSLDVNSQLSLAENVN